MSKYEINPEYNIGDTVYINGTIYDEIASVSDNRITLKFHKDMSFDTNGQEVKSKNINHFLSKLYQPKFKENNYSIF